MNEAMNMLTAEVAFRIGEAKGRHGENRWQLRIDWGLVAQVEQIKATNRLAAAIEAQVELAERNHPGVVTILPPEFGWGTGGAPATK